MSLAAAAMQTLVGTRPPEPIVAVALHGGREVGWPTEVAEWAYVPGGVQGVVTLGPSATPFTVDAVRYYHGTDVLIDIANDEHVLVPAGQVYVQDVVFGGDTVG